MKKLIVALLLFTSSTILYAQDKLKVDLSQQIDEQLWKPFKEAYEARDAEKYIELHTDDILRITKNGIRQGAIFKNGVIESYSRKDRPERTIDFKFEHRIHSDKIAYEVGYFKVVQAKQGAIESRATYGRFHVVLKKMDGTWKIAQDWDTDTINGTPITSKDYDKLIK